MKNLSNTEVDFLRLLKEKYNFEFLSSTHSLYLEDSAIIPKESRNIDEDNNVIREMRE